MPGGAAPLLRPWAFRPKRRGRRRRLCSRALLPIGLPLGFYLYGRWTENYGYQVSGLAMGQAAILALGITSTIKFFTGRRPPGATS